MTKNVGMTYLRDQRLRKSLTVKKIYSVLSEKYNAVLIENDNGKIKWYRKANFNIVEIIPSDESLNPHFQ